jgi:hypothetical protein
MYCAGFFSKYLLTVFKVFCTLFNNYGKNRKESGFSGLIMENSPYGL